MPITTKVTDTIIYNKENLKKNFVVLGYLCRRKVYSDIVKLSYKKKRERERERKRRKK